MEGDLARGRGRRLARLALARYCEFCPGLKAFWGQVTAIARVSHLPCLEFRPYFSELDHLVSYPRWTITFRYYSSPKNYFTALLKRSKMFS